MARKKEMTEEEAQNEVSVWLGDAQQNVEDSVAAFAMQWMPAPRFDIGVEVMDVRQLRDALGIRLTSDFGDPWPAAERKLLDLGFRWHIIGSSRVMLLKEKDGFIPDTGWEDAEEVKG